MKRRSISLTASSAQPTSIGTTAPDGSFDLDGATGNNLKLQGDLTRRALLCRAGTALDREGAAGRMGGLHAEALLLRVLHAPLSGGVVEVTESTLPEYVAAIRSSTGILVARPLWG